MINQNIFEIQIPKTHTLIVGKLYQFNKSIRHGAPDSVPNFICIFLGVNNNGDYKCLEQNGKTSHRVPGWWNPVLIK